MSEVSDYTNLVTSEHAGQPNLTATITLNAQAAVDAQTLLGAMVGVTFDLYTAVGSQLDAVGVRVGISRSVDLPTSGVTLLDDDTYRLLIRAKIIANSWDSTVAGAAAALSELFTGTELFILDNCNLSMTFAISGTWPSTVFQEIIASNEIGLKPAGIAVSYVITSVSGTPIFGFDVENEYISGFDVGAWAVPMPAS